MSNPKILIVEDEAIVAEDIAGRLEKVGYVVSDIKASGEDALVSASEAHPDLVLMDIMLQGNMDGIETAQQIRSELDIPVVYLTANADESTLQRAKVTEPFGYIVKPFNERELRAAIEISLSRHKTEFELNQARVEAEQQRQVAQLQNERKEQYLAVTSHEFRTPLSVIRVAAELLQNYPDRLTEAKAEQHLQRIRTATDTMYRLLEDVLTLGKTNSDTFKVTPEPINLVSFCSELIDALRWSEEEQQELVFEHQDGLETAYLDKGLLWHLLNNLLSNALKYSPKDSVITLKLSFVEDAFHFQVIDQGIGIPKEDRDLLFEPFRRARNVGKISGTGMGLAIAKRVVDLHGGEINIDSIVGEGTTITAVLPSQKEVW